MTHNPRKLRSEICLDLWRELSIWKWMKHFYYPSLHHTWHVEVWGYNLLDFSHLQICKNFADDLCWLMDIKLRTRISWCRCWVAPPCGFCSCPSEHPLSISACWNHAVSLGSNSHVPVFPQPDGVQGECWDWCSFTQEGAVVKDSGKSLNTCINGEEAPPLYCNPILHF
jgi:hypothetical protein